jgi:hypothetical protein
MSTGLTPKQQKAIAHLLTCGTYASAAAQTGITERTLYRWLHEPQFTAAFTQAKQALMACTMTRLQAGSHDALEALHTALTDPRTPSTSKVQAARIWLDYAFHAAEFE